MAPIDARVLQTLRASRRKKPPKDDGPPVRAIPGYGDYVNRSIEERNRPPVTDNSTPRWRSSTPKQRAPYRPGQRNKRRYPLGAYDRGDASRPHRPTLD